MPLLLVIASVLAGLGIVQMTFLLGQGVYRAAVWSRDAAALRVEVRDLERDIAVLEAARARAATPEYLEELARCQGFVGAGERVVVDEKAAPPASDASGNCEPVPLP